MKVSFAIAAAGFLHAVPAAALPNNWGSLPSAARTALSTTLLSSPQDIQHVSYRDDGSFRYLAADSIAPNCMPSGVLSISTAASFVSCVFSAAGGLLDHNGEDTRAVDWYVSSVSAPGLSGDYAIRVRQRRGGLDVKGGELVLVIQGNQLLSAHGRLYPPSKVPPVLVSGPSRAAVEGAATAGQSLGQVELVQRYFDPRRQAVFSEFTTSRPGWRVVVNEETLSVDREYSTALPYTPTLVSKSTSVGEYEAFENPPGGTQSLSAEVDEVDYYWSCRYCLDHGSDAADGEPKVTLSEGGATRCLTYYNSSCAAVSEVFTGYPSTDDSERMNIYFWLYDLAGVAKHSRSALDAWTPWTNAKPLEVVVPSSGQGICGAGKVACADTNASAHYIGVPLSMGGAHDLGGTMAHEYGHIMAYMYGHTAASSFEETSIAEGWGDHFALRYAMFRHLYAGSRPHDDDYSGSYFDIVLGRHVVKKWYYRGEAIPYNPDLEAGTTYPGQPPSGASTAVAESGATNMVWLPGDGNTSCHFMPAGMRINYSCGRLISYVYWQLAWGLIRVPFNGVAAGQGIITNTIYDDQQDFLANAAFTYAIKYMPADGDLEDFFNKVSEQYYAYQTAGIITSAERHRVNQVLTVHCVGWSGSNCVDYHRTVGQRHPAILTDKSEFTSGKDLDVYFRRAEDWTVSATAEIETFGTDDDAGYVVLSHPSSDGSGEQFSQSVTFPGDGYYRFEAAVNAQGTCCDSAWVQIDSASQIYWDFADKLNGAGWSWSWDGTADTGETTPCTYVSDGPHTVKIKERETMEFDAVLIRKVDSCP